VGAVMDGNRIENIPQDAALDRLEPGLRRLDQARRAAFLRDERVAVVLEGRRRAAPLLIPRIGEPEEMPDGHLQPSREIARGGEAGNSEPREARNRAEDRSTQ